MNQKIIDYLLKNLRESFKLERWEEIRKDLGMHTVVDDLPWTPRRLEKFKQDIVDTFDIDPNMTGTVLDVSEDIDHKYATRFWGGGIWQPRTDVYQYSGWNIVEEINGIDPKAVLDVGCGYNQFKPRIKNLVGIDKYNNSADYMVDILDYDVEPNSYDAVIVFGSINFGSYADVSARFKKVFDLTAPGGKIYVRANPGETHKTGPWIEIFPWNFKHAHSIAIDIGAKMLVFKQDNGNRLFFIYQKP